MEINFQNYETLLVKVMGGGFKKEFARFMRMAYYLQDVDREADRICKDYETWKGIVRI